MTAPDRVTAAALEARALALLRANDAGGFIKPARHQYPHQWNWDAAFVAIGLRHVDPALARREVEALLAAQWRDGMVPHIVYHRGASDYFPTPDFWRTDPAASVGGVESSGLTQPPVLATAVRLLEDVAPDEQFLRRVYPRLRAWHRWLHEARDPDGTGLVAIVHPWESGTDDSPRFASSLAAIEHPAPPPFLRRDHRHVAAEERPRPGDYVRFMHLIGLFRDWAWDAEALYRRSPFLVQDVLFNSILHRANADLASLARALGEPTDEIEAWRARARGAFAERLWDEEEGAFVDLDLRRGGRVRERTCASFGPLFAGVAGAAHADRTIDEHLLDPARYAPGAGSRYYLPSVAKDGRGFEPRRYWRGPVWVHVNWLVIHGLLAHGRHELAATIARHTIDLVERGGFVEYFDPRDGSPCGARDFSWSAALAIDLLRDAAAA